MIYFFENLKIIGFDSGGHGASMGICCKLTVLGLWLSIATPCFATTSEEPWPVAKELTVIVDQNYPPYVIRGLDGTLQGIIPSLWELWSRKTGITVHLKAYDWPDVLQKFSAGEGDVIDSIFRLPEREKTYDFGAPYADVEISLFVADDVKGVHDGRSARGFVVGVAEYDICPSRLAAEGVETVKRYPSFESLAAGAARGEVKVFCMDRPSADYFLARNGAEDRFWFSPQIYSVQLAWATRPGAGALKRVITQGFNAISPKERRSIEVQWQGGAPFRFWARLNWHQIWALLMPTLTCLILLAAWVWSLRIKVAAATSELRAAHDNLARKEGAFRTLTEHSPDYVARHDRDGRFLYASPTLCQYFGMSKDEIVGHWPHEIHSKDWQCVAATIESEIGRCISERNVRIVELSIAADCMGELRLIPEFDENGRVVSILSLCRDITRQKNDQLAMERLNRVLRTIEAANAVIFQSGDKKTLFEETCRAIVETGAYCMAWIGLLEAGSDETVSPVAHAGYEAGYLSLGPFTWRRGGDGGRLELALDPEMVRSATQGRGYASTITLPLRDEEEVFGCLEVHATDASFLSEESALFSDLANNLALGYSKIRERRRREEMERQIQQAQKLETLGQLASGIAHDFNNLLGAIIGFAGFIAQDARSDDPTGYHAERILMAGRRGKALINQILSFSRRGGFDLEVFPLSDLVSETYAMLAATLPSTTRFSLSVDDGLAIEGDRDRILQLLVNLCVNAHDSFGGRPGDVQISVASADIPDYANSKLRISACARTEIQVEEDGWTRMSIGLIDPSRRILSLTVTDQGCGMGRAILDQIFTPFFTTKGPGRGTGLGLSIVLNVASTHGGAVIVRSREGMGTQVKILLPLANVATSSPETASSKEVSASLKGKRLLLINDDPDHGDMLVTALERQGCEVSPGIDPIDALAELSRNPQGWDAVVTDHTMPHMTGMELIGRIRGIREDMPCILCTGGGKAVIDDVRLRATGGVALLRKPLDIGELIKTISRAVGKGDRRIYPKG